MKILQICKKFPYPLKDGESIAINYLSKALVDAGCEVSLLSMNTSKHFVDLSSFPTTCAHYKRIYSVNVDNKIKYLDAFLNLFTRESYHVSRFISASFNNKLKEVLTLHTFDIVQLETMYLTPYISTIRKYSDARVVMRSHNVEHKIWERVTANTNNIFKKYYLKYLTSKLKSYEKAHINDYDSIISVSDHDLGQLKSLGFKNGAIASPIGLNIEKYHVKQDKKKLSPNVQKICFIGALDWMPNQEGLFWFLRNIWSKILEEFPDSELHIAGRNTSEFWHEIKGRNINIHGEVDDSFQFIKDHDLMVVPLLSGSGTRVKILESMALGVPVISTRIGFEGITIEEDNHIVAADNAQEFVAGIKKLIENPDYYQNIKRNARDYIEKNYNHHAIARRLKEYYEVLHEEYV